MVCCSAPAGPCQVLAGISMCVGVFADLNEYVDSLEQSLEKQRAELSSKNEEIEELNSMVRACISVCVHVCVCVCVCVWLVECYVPHVATKICHRQRMRGVCSPELQTGTETEKNMGWGCTLLHTTPSR